MAYKVFDPHKSFLCLPIVWLTIVILASLSVIIGWVITCHSEISLDLSYEGMNHFIAVFRLPLGISALIIPIVALLAANHRSEQTKEQIRVANAQNVFSNYYKHLEEFTKYIDSLNEKNGMSYLKIDGRHAHSIFYSRASDGDYSLSDAVIEIINVLLMIPNDLLLFCKEQPLLAMNDKLGSDAGFKILKGIGMLDGKGQSDDFFRKGDVDNDMVNSCIYISKNIIIKSVEVLGDIASVCKFSHEVIAPEKILLLRELSYSLSRINLVSSENFSVVPPELRATLHRASSQYKDIAEQYLIRDKSL